MYYGQQQQQQSNNSKPYMQQKNHCQILGLQCIQNNQVQFFCCSEKCKNNAFICRHSKCQCLPTKHLNCQYVFAEGIMDKIWKKKRKMNQKLQKAIDSIEKIYQQLIDKLSLDRHELRIWKDNYGLSYDEIKLLNLLTELRVNEVNGELIWNIKQNINASNSFYMSEEWVKQFWKKYQSEFEKVFTKLKSISRVRSIDIDSKIIKGTELLLQFIQKPVHQFKLHYRASDNKFSVSEFHKKCDGISNTITVLETEFGKIIGGYTPIPWKSTQNPQSSADSTKQSFLFSLSLGQKYPIIDEKYAVGFHTSCGPCFGRFGNDIGIAEAANLNEKSYCDFPNRYNNGKCQKSQKISTLFCGAQKGNHFKIKEWEVFEVLWLIDQF